MKVKILKRISLHWNQGVSSLLSFLYTLGDGLFPCSFEFWGELTLCNYRTDILIFLLTVNWELSPTSRDWHTPWFIATFLPLQNQQWQVKPVHNVPFWSFFHCHISLWRQKGMVPCFSRFMWLDWAHLDNLGSLSDSKSLTVFTSLNSLCAK